MTMRRSLEAGQLSGSDISCTPAASIENGVSMPSVRLSSPSSRNPGTSTHGFPESSHPAMVQPLASRLASGVGSSHPFASRQERWPSRPRSASAQEELDRNVQFDGRRHANGRRGQGLGPAEGLQRLAVKQRRSAAGLDFC